LIFPRFFHDFSTSTRVFVQQKAPEPHGGVTILWGHCRRSVAKKLGLPIVARFRSFACVAGMTSSDSFVELEAMMIFSLFSYP